MSRFRYSGDAFRAADAITARTGVPMVVVEHEDPLKILRFEVAEVWPERKAA